MYKYNMEGYSIMENEIMEILNKYPKNEKSNLIQILNEFQERDGYISEQVMLDISKHLGITLAEVFSVVSFYARFTLEHAGKYHITVCLGTACFVKGSERILDRFRGQQSRFCRCQWSCQRIC